MPGPAILIAPAELLPALSARIHDEAPELQTFPDTDALIALAAITRARPALVILERRFSLTSRGSALVARIKADPSLTDTEVRVLQTDGESVAPATAAAARETRQPAGRQAPVAAAIGQELDYRGTRRATRHRVSVSGGIEFLLDNARATLVDLSTGGAQILSQAVLKPSQRVRVSMTDDHGSVKCAATVAWASFEIPRGSGARYRAGLEFVDAEPAAVDAFSRRHRQD